MSCWNLNRPSGGAGVCALAAAALDLTGVAAGEVRFAAAGRVGRWETQDFGRVFSTWKENSAEGGLKVGSRMIQEAAAYVR